MTLTLSSLAATLPIPRSTVRGAELSECDQRDRPERESSFSVGVQYWDKQNAEHYFVATKLH